MFIDYKNYFLRGAVAEWFRYWIPDSKVAGTNPPIGHKGDLSMLITSGYHQSRCYLCSMEAQWCAEAAAKCVRGNNR